MTDEHDDEILGLEAIYSETGNPLHLFDALKSIPRPDSVPEWIWAYLITIAWRLVALGNDRQESPATKLRRLAALMQFTRCDEDWLSSRSFDYGYDGFKPFPGKNAFGDFADDNRNARVTEWYDWWIEKGWPAKVLIERIMDELGCSESAAWRYMAKARKLWEAQRHRRA